MPETDAFRKQAQITIAGGGESRVESTDSGDRPKAQIPCILHRNRPADKPDGVVRGSEGPAMEQGGAGNQDYSSL